MDGGSKLFNFFSALNWLPLLLAGCTDLGKKLVWAFWQLQLNVIAECDAVEGRQWFWLRITVKITKSIKTQIYPSAAWSFCNFWLDTWQLDIPYSQGLYTWTTCWYRYWCLNRTDIFLFSYSVLLDFFFFNSPKNSCYF